MVASRALAHVVDVLEPRLEDSPAEIKHDGTVDTAVGNVLDLMRANPENAAPIRESLVDSAAVHLSGSKASPLVAEVMLGLRRGAKPDNLARSVGSALMERSGPELFKLAEADEGLAADLVLEAHMSAVDFIGHHGVEAFLTHRWFRVFPASERVSLAEISLASILWSGQWGLSLEEAESALTAMKPRLSDRELPWHTARTQHTGWLFIGAPSGEFVPRKVSAGDLDPDVRFSFIALACAFWEETLAANEQGVQSGFGNSQSVGELNGPASSLWQSLLPILAARRELSPNLEAISALELPPDSKDLIVRWAQGEVSLVRMVAPNKRAT
jgi:hypothetical protein